MNNKKKVMLVFGTRPEAIKMGPLFHKLNSEPEIFDVKVCVTGQHREMLDQALALFEIQPDIDLNIMMPKQGLSFLTAGILEKFEAVLFEFKPDIVLVHGDTTTTLATAISAFYAGIPIGHVEAGLRTNNIHSPFPEEFNRQVTSKIAKWHFAPTIESRKNLIAENISEKNIVVSGNTVIDALYWVLNRIENDEKKSLKLDKMLNKILDFNWKKDRIVLITCHRRENFGKGITQICKAIGKLASKFKDIKFVYPVHLNPNIQNPVRNILKNTSNVFLIKPLNYEPFVYLLKHCYIILTDSGGIQEEAPSLGIPVLVMRNVTERPEALNAGTVELVGANEEIIVNKTSMLINDLNYYTKMAQAHNPYGDGKACERIIKALQN